MSYGLRKDNKLTINPMLGLPTTSLCGANIAINYRNSLFHSLILRTIIEKSPGDCDNAEDLLASIDNFENTCDLTECIGAGFDVERRLEVNNESEI